MKNLVEKTHAELVAERNAIAANIDAKITAWNEASLNADFRAMVTIDTELKELEKDYAEVSQATTFKALDGNMLEAIKLHSFPIIKHKDSAESGSTVKTRERVDSEKQFDLYDFDCFNGSGASVNANWVRMAENFNMLCCIHVANELKVEDLEKIGKSYFISKAAAQVKLAEEGDDIANPISNTQMLKYLQKVCDNIVYEEKTNDNGESMGNTYKVKSQDVAWMLFTYGRKDSKGKITLKVADHKNFRKILGDVMYRVCTNGDYKVAYKEMLKK